MRTKLIVLALVPVVAQANPLFEQVDVAPHVYDGGWEFFVGGGVAAFDCNADNLPDLYAAGGENPASLLRNTSERGGAVSFVLDTPAELAIEGVTGAYPLDIDNDGILDLAVLRVGENQLLKGQGDCRFTLFDYDLGDHDQWTTAFSATWEEGHSLPTLAFGNYVDRHDPNGPFQTCDDSLLFRPSGADYGAPFLLTPGFCTLSILFSDWGRQGRADLRVSNDRHYYVKGGAEQLWSMEATPRLYTADDGWKNYQIWGMGIASRDLTGDGLPEVYLTSMGDQKLQALEPGAKGPTYRDATYERGTTAHRPYEGGDGRPSTGWHVAFADVQNDGLDDIFVAKGNVEQMPGAAMKDPNNLLIQQPDASFAEFGGAAGLGSMDRSRGAAMVDFNLDGLLDLAVVNRRARLQVYRNVTPDAGNWLTVHLSQVGVNTQAIGAWIELRSNGTTQFRELVVGGGHAGGVAGAEHFGLGTAETAEIRVVWPEGDVSDWISVQVNQHLAITPNGAGLTLVNY
ncbi:hypothetical protein ACMU_00650 [Actibacterium mucosum KCTC 23349]|uniref:ASPIC/UnbV domain-containing protein n=1 Tax=Actibacterium mucosum KCTC 23349 TaxID=1454373 RepID=A0A037ZNB7_9RHOB|nr:CRTAC1 family protein [Actibacterium mucosum]KAJ57033.1 hypothetical protein ACMU_00650 [Actibacterium mucosum KCTC 23349]